MNHSGELFDGLPVTSALPSLFIREGRQRRVAIVGSHSATRENAPYDDLSFEIWLFNEAAQKGKVYRRWDALLQIHSPDVYTSSQNWVNSYHWDWLQCDHGLSEATGEPKRIFMQDVDPRVPNSVKYPLDGILSLVPYRYLRSSPAMALALAIYQGYDHIQLYGSELESSTEYAYQATNYAFWIGFAHGRGINLELNCWQSEFNQRIYGFEGELDLPRDYFAERAAENEKAWRTNESVLKKARERIDQAILDHKYDEVAKLTNEAVQVALVDGETAGALAEAERYNKRDNFISRQEYERTAAQAQEDYNKRLQQVYISGGKWEYVWNVWRARGTNDALQQLRLFTRERIQAAYDAGALKGIFGENIHYMGEYDSRLKMAGGERALGTVTQGA